MRDLDRILKNIKIFNYDESFLAVCTERNGGMLSFPLGVVYEAMERAIKAEAEVERLYEINQGCESEARLYDDLLRRCRVENAQLRKVADAARGVFLGEGEHPCSEFENAMDRLRQALAELDEEPSND